MTSSHSNLLTCIMVFLLVLHFRLIEVPWNIPNLNSIKNIWRIIKAKSWYSDFRTRAKVTWHIKRLLWDDVINDFCKIWPNSCQQRIWESWREVKFWMLKFCKDLVFVTLWSILLSIKWLAILQMDPLISFNNFFMWKMKMTPGVFWPQYLSFYLTKIQNQGQFWNPQNQHISKLTSLFKFGEDWMKILPKNKLGSFFVDTV